jgi:hypothetical protein
MKHSPALEGEKIDPLIGAAPSLLLERAAALLAEESSAWAARRDPNLTPAP